MHVDALALRRGAEGVHVACEEAGVWVCGVGGSVPQLLAAPHITL